MAVTQMQLQSKVRPSAAFTRNTPAVSFQALQQHRRATHLQASKRNAQVAVKERATKVADTVQQTSFAQRLVAAQEKLNEQNVSWTPVLGTALLTSVTFGSFIQTTHNNVLLPVYDLWYFKIGPAYESGLVPILLAPIWVLYAYLQPLADAANKDDPATQQAIERASSLAYNLLNWGSVSALNLWSGYVYLSGWPHWQCSATLAVLALANWKAFDNTKQGLLLAALLFVGAPLTEMFIVNVLHLWHYNRPDFFNVPHWAGWCYASYAIGCGNFGRYLTQKLKRDA